MSNPVAKGATRVQTAGPARAARRRRTWRALRRTALAALLPLALLTAPAAAAPPPGGSGILAPTADTQRSALPRPQVVAVTPQPAYGGGRVVVTVKEDAPDLVQADADLTGDGVRLSASGLALQGGAGTWTFDLALPPVSTATSVELRVRVVDGDGLRSPPSFAYGLTIDPPPPVNQLPEAPYAAVFPAALLAAFALARRRRAA
jgi:MYXO-CTERM domain-containing protein